MANTQLTNAIHNTQGISGYDAAAKLLFSYKIVIAFLLAALVPEFYGIDVKTIAAKYVDPFHPGERVMGLNTDSLLPRGRGFRFDLLVEILTPSGTIMLLNIEIQRAFYRAQSIFERSWSYVTRIYNDRYGTAAAASGTKVCGLWILSKPPKKLANTVTYVLPLCDAAKEYPRWSTTEQKNAAPLQNIMVCTGAGNPNSMDYEIAADFAHVLLDPMITAGEKIKSLTNNFGLPMGKGIREVLTKMGNFGTDVLEDGIRIGKKIGNKIGKKRGEKKGEKKGKAEGVRDEQVRILSFMTSQGKMSLKDAMNTVGLPLADEAVYAALLDQN